MRRLATLALVAALLVAGCVAPTATTDTPTDEQATGTTRAPATPTEAQDRSDPAPSDPESDVQGWEQGYWYNESLPVDAADGYNESELDAVVARAMARVEVVRDVEFDRDVDVSIVSRSELDTGGGGAGDAATARRVRLRALFLVGDGRAADNASESTRRATVSGYYSPREDRIVVVSPTDTPQVAELTLAHELVHAHQFRHRQFDLPPSPSADAIAAFRALVEGEANFVERRYRRRCEADWSCATPEASDEESAADGSREIHMGLYLQGYFPYAEGEELVAAAYERGGWAAVTGLFVDPPRSTEEVIHPDRRDPPERVEVPDRSGATWLRLPVGRDRDSVVLGESALATMFMYTAYDDREGELIAREQFLNLDDGSVDPADPIDYVVNYSDGWAGDGLAVYERGEETAYVWRIRWDSAAEAEEFREGYARLLTYRGGDRVGTDGNGTYWRLSGAFAGGYYVERDGRTVTIVHAPSVDGLDDVWAPADRGGE